MSHSPGEPLADPVSEQEVTEVAAEPTAVDGVAINASAVESGQQLFSGCVCMQSVMTAVMLAVHSTTPTQYMRTSMQHTVCNITGV